MSNIVIGTVQTANEAFINWVTPFVVVGGVAIGLVVLAIVTVVIANVNRRRDAD